MRNGVIMYMKFCNDFSADIDKTENLKIMLIFFLKNTDKLNLYNSLYSEDSRNYIDWKQQVYSKGFDDSFAWFSVLDLLEFNCAEWTKLISTKMFGFFCKCMSDSGIVLEKSHHVLKLFVLLNIMFLDARHVMESYLDRHNVKEIREKIMFFFPKIANQSFDRETVTATMEFVFLHCRVKHFELSKELEHLKSEKESLKGLFQQKRIEAVAMRPQLRSKVKRSHVVQDVYSMDLYDAWCERVRFPPVFENKMKRKLYFLMSQTPEIQARMGVYVHDKKNLDNVLKFPVKHPEPSKLAEIIMSMCFRLEPFPELHLFREKAFGSFALSQLAMIKQNDMLHLYVCIYLPNWKEIWKNILPILTIQIIKDMETFSASNACNYDAIFEILFNS